MCRYILSTKCTIILLFLLHAHLKYNYVNSYRPPKSDLCYWERPCRNLGYCENTADGFKCKCYEQFYEETGDCSCMPGKKLCVKSYCGSSPCQNGGTCVDMWGSYFCTCAKGFQGHNCDKQADDNLKRMDVPTFLYDVDSTTLETSSILFVLKSGNTGDNFKWTAKIDHNLAEVTPLEFGDITDSLKHLSSEHLKEKYLKGVGNTNFRILQGHFYQTSEEVPIEVEAYNNNVLQFSSKYFMNVKSDPRKCTPKVTLKGCSRYPLSPNMWNRMDEFVIRSLVEPDCWGFHSSLAYKWTLTQTTQMGRETIELANPTDKMFVIRPYTLSYGSYFLSLEVKECIDDESLTISYHNFGQCYIEMIALPVVARILGGNSVFASNKEDLVVSATPSYNPNYNDGKKHLKYKWTCLSSTETQMCAKDTFKDRVVIKRGRLKIGLEITFSVTVSDDLFSSLTNRKVQKVQIEAEASPVLNIVCVANCGEIILPHPGRTIAMKVECLGKCSGSNQPSYYEWDIGGDPPAGWVDKAPFGRNSVDFYIKGDTLKPGQTYAFQVTGGIGKYKTVRKLSMRMGQKPTPGTCNIEPKKGISRKTIFEATCQGFESFSKYKELHYDFYQCDNADTLGRLIEYGNEPRALFFLTTDDKNSVCVKVTDGYGMSVTQVLNVQVDPLKDISVKDIKSPKSLLSLNYAVKTGDPAVLTAHMMFLMEIAPNFEEEVASYIKRKVLETFSKVPVNCINSVTLTASSILKLLGRKELSPIKIEDSGAISPAIRKAGQKFADILTEFPNNGYISEHWMQVSMILLKSTSHILAHNPPFQPEVQVEMDYPVYSELFPKVVREKVNMEIATYDSYYVIRQVGRALYSYSVPSDTPVKYDSEEFKMWFMVTKPYSIKDFLKEIDKSENTIDFSEALSTFFAKLKPHLGPQLTVFKGDRFWWYKLGNTTNTPIISFDIHHTTTTKLRLPTPLDVYFSVTETTGSDYTVSGEIDMAANWNDPDVFDLTITLHQIRANKGDVLCVLFESIDTSKKYKVMATINRRPALEDVAKNSKIIPADEEPKLWYTSNEIVNEDATFIYLGLVPGDKGSGGGTVKYTMKVFLIKCQYWDENLLEWTSEGCYMGKKSSNKNIHCKCNHLSVFSGLRAVPPNKIDFLKVFSASLDVADNPYILILILCLFLIFLILFIFGYIEDKRDRIRRELVFIDDNIPGYSYVYLIGVFTGNKWDAKTTANVAIELVGDKCKSRTHILNGKRKFLFERNSDNWFILLTSKRLGNINYLRLWHDNAGSSPSWYCDRIIVRDIQNNDEWIFLLQEWLSFSKGSGHVYYIISETPPKVLKSFDVLFPANTLQLVERDHPWLRVYMRHPRSPQSRCRRIILLLSNILLSMLLNLCFFGIPKGGPEDTIEFGDFGVSRTEIIISIETAIATIPLMLILTIMFKKTVPREVYDIHVVKDGTATFVEGNSGSDRNVVGKAELVTLSEPLHGKENSFPAAIVNFVGYVEEEPLFFSPNINMREREKVPDKRSSEPQDISRMKKYELEKPEGQEMRFKILDKILFHYWFPAWFIYVAWTLAVCICLVCATLIIFYGFSYGKVKSKAWVVATVGSNCIGSLFMSPLKIVLMAVLLSWILKKQPSTMEITGVIYINTDKFYPQDPTSLTLYMLKLNLKRTRKMYQPLNDAEAKHIRVMECKKAAYVETFHSFIFFIVYMVLLYCVIIGIRDSVAFYKSITIKSILTKGIKSHSIDDITDTQHWIDYYNETVIPALYEITMYNETPLTQTGWAFDINTFLVGIVRLRQIRVMEDTCEYPPNLNDSTRLCSPEYSWLVANDQCYYIEWTKRKTRALYSSQANMPWIYQTSTESGSWSLYGAMSIYGGGGYVANLGRTRLNSKVILNFLDEFKWFDAYTRAVIAEYTTFNPNRNLFSLDSVIVEKSATGAIFSNIQSYTVMLLPGGDAWGTILKIIPVVFLFVLLVMLWLLFLKVQKVGARQYFRQPWNCVDAAIVSLGVSGVALCFVRHSDLLKLVADLQTSERNEFVSFHGACLFDRALVYLLSVLLCLSTARLWKTLDVFENFHRFNVTLKLAAHLLTVVVAVIVAVLFLFVVLSHVILSTSALYYSSLYESLCSVLAATFKYGPQLDYRLFAQRHFTVGYLLCLLYGFAVKIVLLNVVIVIILIYYRNVSYMLGHTGRKGNFYSYLKQRMAREPKKRLRGGGDVKPLASLVVHHNERSPPVVSKRNRNLKVNEEKLRKTKLAMMQRLTTDILKENGTGGCLPAIVVNEFENSNAQDGGGKEYEHFYRGVAGDGEKLVPKERLLDMKVLVEDEISKLGAPEEDIEKLIEQVPREDVYVIKNGVWDPKYDPVLEALFRDETGQPGSQSRLPKNLGKPHHKLDEASADHLQRDKGSSGQLPKDVGKQNKKIDKASTEHPLQDKGYEIDEVPPQPPKSVDKPHHKSDKPSTDHQRDAKRYKANEVSPQPPKDVGKPHHKSDKPSTDHQRETKGYEVEEVSRQPPKDVGKLHHKSDKPSPDHQRETKGYEVEEVSPQLPKDVGKKQHKCDKPSTDRQRDGKGYEADKVSRQPPKDVGKPHHESAKPSTDHQRETKGYEVEEVSRQPPKDVGKLHHKSDKPSPDHQQETKGYEVEEVSRQPPKDVEKPHRKLEKLSIDRQWEAKGSKAEEVFSQPPKDVEKPHHKSDKPSPDRQRETKEREAEDVSRQPPKDVGKPHRKLEKRSRDRLREDKGSSVHELEEISATRKSVRFRNRLGHEKYNGHSSGARESHQRKYAEAKSCCLHLPDFRLFVDTTGLGRNLTYCCIEEQASNRAWKTVKYLWGAPEDLHQYLALLPEHLRPSSGDSGSEEERGDVVDSQDGRDLHIELVEESGRREVKITIKKSGSQVKLFIRKF